MKGLAKHDIMRQIILSSKRALVLLLCLLLLGIQPAQAQAPRLRLYVGGPIAPYANNRILVTSPVEGLLTLRIFSKVLDWTIVEDHPVTAGKNEVFYNGLFFNDEPIHRGSFTLLAQVVSGDQVHQAQEEVKGKLPAPYLQYVLPRTDTLYLQGGVWQADYYHTTGLKLQVSFQLEGEDKVSELVYKKDQNNPLLFTWDGMHRGKKIKPGNYTLYFTAKDANSPQYQAQLKVLNEKPPAYPLKVTPAGHFLPESQDEAAVWQALTAPITVIRGRQLVRDKILAEPKANAQVLGLVSNGTAGVKVLELVGDYAKVGAWRLQDGAYMEGYILQSRLYTYLPNQHWGLVLDKASQRITVYRDGKAIGSTRTSTGLMLAKAPHQESRAGAFTLGQRLPHFDNLGYRYKYAIRVDGRNLMHQLGHPITSRMNFDVEDAVMGQKASHGCLRMDRFPGEGDVNAFWLWTNIPSDTKMLVLDDREQRHQRMLELGLNPSD